MASSVAEAGPPLPLIGAAEEDDDEVIEEDESLRAPSGLQRFKGAGSTVVMALRVCNPNSWIQPCAKPELYPWPS